MEGAPFQTFEINKHLDFNFTKQQIESIKNAAAEKRQQQVELDETEPGLDFAGGERMYSDGWEIWDPDYYIMLKVFHDQGYRNETQITSLLVKYFKVEYNGKRFYQDAELVEWLNRSIFRLPRDVRTDEGEGIYKPSLLSRISDRLTGVKKPLKKKPPRRSSPISVQAAFATAFAAQDAAVLEGEDVWTCDHGCGYNGTYEDVEKHEKECTLNLSRPHEVGLLGVYADQYGGGKKFRKPKKSRISKKRSRKSKKRSRKSKKSKRSRK